MTRLSHIALFVALATPGLASSNSSSSWTPDLSYIANSLRSKLSESAKVWLPGSNEFNDSTITWSESRTHPKFSIAVDVGTEQDVDTVVKVANQYYLPFYARNSGHSGWTGINDLKEGIAINLAQLNWVRVDSRDNGTIGSFGGGTRIHDAMHGLYAMGKRTVTGVCECPSVVGPMLGGGHGTLQGQYGLIADQLVSARVVLANGTAVIASEHENPDLFWALRGAGANFGIVTSVRSRIYDDTGNWTAASFSYKFEDAKLDSVIHHVNSLVDLGIPAKMSLQGQFSRNPAVDTTKPSLTFTIYYDGDEEEAAPYIRGFQGLSPDAVNIRNLTYDKISTDMGGAIDGWFCGKDKDASAWSRTFSQYDRGVMQKLFDTMMDFTSEPVHNQSVIILENFSIKAVQAIDVNSTAIPREERERPLIVNINLFGPLHNETAKNRATEYGLKLRHIMDEAALNWENGPSHTYVSYESSVEDLEVTYGRYDGHLERLIALKKIYDPSNKFRYYNPLIR